MSMACGRPLVGIPASIVRFPEHNVPIHGSGERYVTAVRDAAGADAFLIPALGAGASPAMIVERIDGLFLSGGRANIEPHHYGGPPFPDDEPRDPARDATVLPLIRACIDGGVPVFGVCRGLQEINVALGGSLHYRVHLVDGKMDHRMRRDVPVEDRFGPRHDVSLTPGGAFARLTSAGEVMVNSAHGQGIDRLACGVDVEARASDGLIEGIRVRDTRAFAIGVQWHAEWHWEGHDLSRLLFAEFGAAARRRAARRPAVRAA